MTDDRLFYPATQRNRDAILDVLRSVLPASGLVLEIASGSGEGLSLAPGQQAHLSLQAHRLS